MPPPVERRGFAVDEKDVSVTTIAYQRVSSQTQRDELILGHLSLVRHILGRLVAKLPAGIDLDNLEAAGTLGLVEAANRFDPERGINFKTYAYTRIRGAIYDELRRNCPLPQELLERIAKIKRVLQKLPPPVSTETLARETGIPEDEVIESLAAARMTRVLSWDSVKEPEHAGGTRSAEPPESRLEETERRKLLVDAITDLPESERVAVTLYYMEDLRLKEIGQVLNLSESRVSRLLKAAEHRIEQHIRAREEAL
jgi:RNA polymerase sigma factor for flagellar operon FliA